MGYYVQEVMSLFDLAYFVAVGVLLVWFIWATRPATRRWKAQRDKMNADIQKRASDFRFWNDQCVKSARMMKEAKDAKDFYAYSRAKQAHETNMRRLERLIQK
jgi:hypothetical protein